MAFSKYSETAKKSVFAAVAFSATLVVVSISYAALSA